MERTRVIERLMIKLANRRLELGIAQNELADRLGITPQAMNAIEKGRRNPSLVLLGKICVELRVGLILHKDEY